MVFETRDSETNCGMTICRSRPENCVITGNTNVAKPATSEVNVHILVIIDIQKREIFYMVLCTPVDSPIGVRWPPGPLEAQGL